MEDQDVIYTHHAPHMSKPWTAWDKYPSSYDFCGYEAYEWMGFGDTEQEAIDDFRAKENN